MIRPLRLRHLSCLAAILAGLLVLLPSGCGGGGSDGADDGGNGSNDQGESVSTTMDASGGTLSHPTGVSLTLGDGAIQSSATVGITDIGPPADLPTNIIAGARAYRVSGLEGTPLATPARLSFPSPDPELPAGAIGIYRWDDVEWTFVGGDLDPIAGRVNTEVDGFSVFVLGTGASLHKTVTFSNADLLHSYVVSPFQYVLAHPDLDSPIGNLSVVVFDRAGHTARMSLPQGRFTFCVRWDSGSVDGLGQRIYRHSITGTLPDDPAITVTSETNQTVPPNLLVGSGGTVITGPCPAPQMLNPSSGAGTGINLGDPEVTLTWNNDNDLDLWVVSSAGTISVGWANPGPAADTARLDVDERCADDMPGVGEGLAGLKTSVSNGGPEHIYWQGQSNLLAQQSYAVWVNFFRQCDGTLAGPDSLPRIRLVIGNNVDFFPGTDVGTDMVMSTGNPWCRLYEFDRGVWPPRKCGRDFVPCCNLNGP